MVIIKVPAPLGFLASLAELTAVLKRKGGPESSGGFVKTPSAGPLPRAFHAVDLGWNLRIYMPNKLLRDADVTGLGTTLGEPLACNNACHTVSTW